MLPNNHISFPNPIQSFFRRILFAERPDPIEDGKFKNPFAALILRLEKEGIPRRILPIQAVHLLVTYYNDYATKSPDRRIEVLYHTPPPLYSDLRHIPGHPLYGRGSLELDPPAYFPRIPSQPLYGKDSLELDLPAFPPRIPSQSLYNSRNSLDLDPPPYNEVNTNFFQKLSFPNPWKKNNTKQKLKTTKRKLEKREQWLREGQARFYKQAQEEKGLWIKVISRIQDIETDADNQISLGRCSDVFDHFQKPINKGIKGINRTETKLDRLVTQRFYTINKGIERSQTALEEINRTITQKTEEQNCLLLETEEIPFDEEKSLITEDIKKKEINKLQQEIDHLIQHKNFFENLIAFFIYKKFQPFPFEMILPPEQIKWACYNYNRHPFLATPKLSHECRV